MAKVDFSKMVQLPTGMSVLNCTPHFVVFKHGEVEIRVEPCGATLPAKAEEEVHHSVGETVFVKAVFRPTQQGLDEIAEMDAQGYTGLVIGSLISAQAYAAHGVVAMVSAPGFERVPPDQKRMDATKFTTFA